MNLDHNPGPENSSGSRIVAQAKRTPALGMCFYCVSSLVHMLNTLNVVYI